MTLNPGKKKRRCHPKLSTSEHSAWHKDYYQSRREYFRATARARYATNRSAYIERRRVSRLNKLYGLSPADYEALLQKQDGRCAICGAKPTSQRLGVDHSHATGLVRGLLCYSCNIRLGQLESTWHELALAYLASRDARARRRLANILRRHVGSAPGKAKRRPSRGTATG